MRRFLVNALAVIGAVSLTASVAAWIPHTPGVVWLVGRAVTFEREPLPGVAVFLDRGSNTIERYTTDSTGTFRLPLFPRETHRATWLICARGMQVRIGKPELDHLLNLPVYSYDVGPLDDATHGSYRSLGWKGPIPRECPEAEDPFVWRYPASAGRGYGAGSFTEPDWSRYPGPPDLPPSR